ncbi:MAG: DNA repair protein RecN [Sphingobacteriia bacterium]|nr:DNA repair protein RecN [Sphingobacteriia bacterium]
MLTNLTIKNIVLIDYLSLNFYHNLSVLTGETGAGKSILLDALSFVLGDRATAKLLRHGTEEGYVIGEFEINDKVKVKLEELAVDYDKSIIIRRIINKEGRTKAFINDIPVSINTLKDIGEHIIEIHGQHDQRWLLEQSYHRIILDEFAENDALLEQVKAKYTAYQNLTKEISELKQQKEKLEQEQDYLSFVLNELNELDPKENEEEELIDKKNTFSQKNKMLETLHNLNNEIIRTNISQAVSNSQRILARNQGLIEQLGLEDLSDQLDSVHSTIFEITSSLEYKINAYSHDNFDEEQVELRLMELKSAARKYRCTVNELANYVDSIKEKIGNFQSIDNSVAKIEKKLIGIKEEYLKLAKEISSKRIKAAKLLEDRIKAELKDLKMDRIQFVVEIKQIDHLHEHGFDEVIFLVSTNPGAPLDKINTIASGGELSRFMLACKIALSEVKTANTIIFDEIDTGIGGATAYAVGRKLKELSSNTQVLVVTHQPQVACFAENHYLVKKEVANNSTTTKVRKLEINDKVNELARMLSGENLTEEAISAAKKLVEEIA